MNDIVLALDTSTPRCAIVLGRVGVDDDTVLAWAENTAPGARVSAQLLPLLRGVVAEAGLRPEAVTVVGCGVGPGMFTGVRVGVATAKGIALGLGVPTVAVSTLAAVAAGEPGPSEERLAILDARRGEVYAGHFRRTAAGVMPIGTECCRPIEQVLQALPPGASVTAVGSGVEPYRARLEAAPAVTGLSAGPGPSARGLWTATVSALRDQGRREAETLGAVYMRKSYAELGIHKPKRPFVKSPFV